MPTIRISTHNRQDTSANPEISSNVGRGAGAFGYFECLDNMSAFTDAAFLGRVGKKSPVLACFSALTAPQHQLRDVRNFSVKFYTEAGNLDLVSNNMPIFFDKASPWSLETLTQDNLATTLWTMSDRALPRSYRMMEGFGIHTFRLVNSKGEGTYARFHWKPRLGRSWNVLGGESPRGRL